LRKHHRFDYQKARPNRFAGRLREESIAVVLDPDVVAVFTSSEEANQALRVLIGALGNLAETPDLLEKVKGSAAAAASPPSCGSGTAHLAREGVPQRRECLIGRPG
jgi:hypothetical protein